MNWVSFPGIGIGKIFLQDYAFEIFGLKIKWYSIILAFAIAISICYALFLANKMALKKEHLLDIIIVGLIFAIIGLRFYYVVFNWDYFSKNILEIFNFRAGGLAIYGGIIFSVLAAYVYCKIKKIYFWTVLDITGVCFLLGQGIGRWGNFVNIEAYGVKTSLPWGMTSNKIPYFMQPVHPTFFYESVWCLLGFVLLNFFIKFFIKYKKFDGQIFLMYISWYSFERFFVEGIRADSLWLVKDFLRVSQVLSFILFFASIFGILYFGFLQKKRRANSAKDI